MNSEPAVAPASPPNAPDTPFESERVSGFIGRPVFLGAILLFVALWIIANTVLRQFGMAEFDPAPYFWLQGIVSLGALLTANVVLAKQNRLSKLAEQRAHLDLKLMLLTEQKAAKLIDLLEELRRVQPNPFFSAQ